MSNLLVEPYFPVSSGGPTSRTVVAKSLVPVGPRGRVISGVGEAG